MDNIKQIIEQVENGNLLELDAFIELNQIKHNLEQGLKTIKDWQQKNTEKLREEAQEYQNIYNGFEFKYVSGRKTYSFKNISEWSEADNKKKEIESKYKSLFEVYQKTNQRPISEDGEVYELPEINYSSSYITLKEVVS